MPQAVLHPGAEVLDHDVGPFDEAEEHGAAVVGGEVDGDRRACCGAGWRRRTPSDENTPPPAGLCTAIASAPRSASWRTQVGPARARVEVDDPDAGERAVDAVTPSSREWRSASAARASRRAVSGMNRASAEAHHRTDDGVRAVERRHPADAGAAADGLERHLGVVVAHAAVPSAARRRAVRGRRGWLEGDDLLDRGPASAGSAGSRPHRRARARPRDPGSSRPTGPTPTTSTMSARRVPHRVDRRGGHRRRRDAVPAMSHRQRRDARDHHDEAEHQEGDACARSAPARARASADGFAGERTGLPGRPRSTVLAAMRSASRCRRSSA